MRFLILGVTILGVPALVSHAAAQTADARRLELGATAASTCLNRSSHCGGGREAMSGFYGSYWITHRVEIGGRVAKLTQPDVFDVLDYNVGVPPERVSVPVATRDRSRLYVLGHVYRHFGPDPRIRVFAGVALGFFKEQWTETCEAPGCEEALTRLDPMLRRGRVSRRPPNVAPGVGIAGRARLLQWRTGISFHIADDDSVGATEFFAGAGIRF